MVKLILTYSDEEQGWIARCSKHMRCKSKDQQGVKTETPTCYHKALFDSALVESKETLPMCSERESFFYARPETDINISFRSKKQQTGLDNSKALKVIKKKEVKEKQVIYSS